MLQKRYFSISILGTVTFLFNFDFMIWKFTLLGFKNRILIQPCLYERVLWEGECDLLERRCSTTYVIICDYRQPSRFQCIWFERGEWEMCVSWTFCDSSSFTYICLCLSWVHICFYFYESHLMLIHIWWSCRRCWHIVTMLS